MATSEAIITPEFRASYVHIWKPQEDKKTGEPVYSVQMIFSSKEDLSKMKKLAKQARIDKFGEAKPPKFKNPFRKGTSDEFDLEKNPEFKGNIIVAARSKNRAVDVARMVDGTPTRLTDKEQGLLYSGCFCRAKVTAYAYSVDGNKGVAFGLQSLLLIRAGEPLVSTSNAENDFKGFEAPDYDDSDLYEDDEDDEDGDDDEL